MKLLLSLLLVFLWTPNTLATPTPKKDPALNFDRFWEFFDQHYANFDIRHVDWPQQYRRFRSSVTPRTTDQELLTIFREMIAPLKDGHVVVSPTGDLPASAEYAPFCQEFPTKELQRQFHQVTLDNLQKQGFDPMTKFNSDPYQIGGYCRSNEYGYLQLNGFGGMPVKEFARQLDEMIDDFGGIKGLIIDIRINGGGSPDYLTELVGRLTQVRRLVGYGRTRVGTPKQEYTPWTAYHVSPRGEKQLIVPTVLLTSGSTISAGDHCALYLKELPYLTQMGENTNGIFSSMFGGTLPNGWEMSLSNGQTVSSKRVNYEGKGVPVDVPITHHRSDMVQGIDPGIDNAIGFMAMHQSELASKTLCYEQLALDFFADSLLVNKTYGDITAYSTGMVEEDATLLAPFARNCASLHAVYNSDGVQKRVEAEEVADSSFYHQNVQHRFYLTLPGAVRSKTHWPFVKRNARRLTISHHITLGDKNYVRLQLNQGGWKGETILVVLDRTGRVTEHCSLSYDYLSDRVYK